MMEHGSAVVVVEGVPLVPSLNESVLLSLYLLYLLLPSMGWIATCKADCPAPIPPPGFLPPPPPPGPPGPPFFLLKGAVSAFFADISVVVACDAAFVVVVVVVLSIGNVGIVWVATLRD